MRFLVRWAFRLFILLVVLVVALVLCKDVLLKSIAETQIRAQTGMDVKMGALEAGLLSPTLTIDNLRLYNPAEFGGSPFLDIPDLHIEYDPAALAFLELHLRLVRVAVSEMNVVESKNGLTNLVLSLEHLADIMPAPAKSEPPSIFGVSFTGIDTLNLTLGRVRFINMRKPENATEVELNLRNEILTDVKSIAEVKQLLAKRLIKNGITIVHDAPERQPPQRFPLKSSPQPRRH